MADPQQAEGQDAGSAGDGGPGAGGVGHDGGADEAGDRPLIEPQTGPGLKPSSRPDPVMVTAVVFALLALIPTTVFRGPDVDLHLGPLQIPVIFAIVAVLFAVLGFLRGHELEDRFIQRGSVAAGAVGLVRLFVYPLLGL